MISVVWGVELKGGKKQSEKMMKHEQKKNDRRKGSKSSPMKCNRLSVRVCERSWRSGKVTQRRQDDVFMPAPSLSHTHSHAHTHRHSDCTIKRPHNANAAKMEGTVVENWSVITSYTLLATHQKMSLVLKHFISNPIK